MDVTEHMHQAATYWPPAGNDGYGLVGFGAPVLIACRWQDTQKMFRDAQGRDVMSEAVVYPDQRVEVGGYLALEDQTATASPRDVGAAREIRQAGVSPSLDDDTELVKVYL